MWALDCAIIGFGFFTIENVMKIQDQSSGMTPLQSFYLGWMWFFQTYHSSFIILNWFPRAVYFVVSIFLGALSDLDITQPEGKTTVMNAKLVKDD